MGKVRKVIGRLVSSVHPASFLRLVIVGFGLVALPLVIALVTGVYYINKLTHQSQEAVSRAVQATQGSRQLLEITVGMERDLRQYLVLAEDELYQRYLGRHKAFSRVAGELAGVLVDPQQRAQLDSLVKMEQSLFERLQSHLSRNQLGRVEPMEYAALTSLARAILRDNNQLIDSEVSIMHEISAKVKNVVFWELLLVLPAVALIIVVFAFLLARPVRQLDQGIRRLGNGEFDVEIEVAGPRDLQYLGDRLNWLRRRLKYLEEKKSKFLHHVSHELKTPLSAIRESAELLADRVAGPLTTQQEEICDILKKNSISLQQMIEKLLSFSLPDDVPEEGRQQLVALPAVLGRVIADHKPVLLSKNIHLELDCDEVSYQGNEQQLQIVFDNLISNAVKFVPENGAIHVCLKQHDGQVVIDVEDSGEGVAEVDRDNIFNEFYKGQAPGSGRIQGTGLGLAIVAEFVEAHGGRIELVEPERLSGAHFRITLPHVDGEEMQWAV